MCKHTISRSNTPPNNHSPPGFIRINPSTAPLNPPGAAPTLTTINDEPAIVHTSTITSPSLSTSLSKEPSIPKLKSKRRKRTNPFGAKAAQEGIVGSEKEKRKTQTIADSLDLGGDLQIVEEDSGSTVVEEGDEIAGRRKAVATEIGLGSVH